MKTEERNEVIKDLKKILRPGDTIYTQVTHVASSGMSRSIILFIGRKREVINITWWVARAMDETIDRTNGGIKVGGCGMDMGFELVYNLGKTLWPKGTSKPHGTRNGVPDHDGGYALKQRWI